MPVLKKVLCPALEPAEFSFVGNSVVVVFGDLGKRLFIQQIIFAKDVLFERANMFESIALHDCYGGFIAMFCVGGDFVKVAIVPVFSECAYRCHCKAAAAFLGQ